MNTIKAIYKSEKAKPKKEAKRKKCFINKSALKNSSKTYRRTILKRNLKNKHILTISRVNIDEMISNFFLPFII